MLAGKKVKGLSAESKPCMDLNPITLRMKCIIKVRCCSRPLTPVDEIYPLSKRTSCDTVLVLSGRRNAACLLFASSIAEVKPYS